MSTIDPELIGLARVHAAIAHFDLESRIVSPGTPMPSVLLAAAAVGSSVDQIIKTVVFSSGDDRAVIAIANGVRRIDRKLLAAAAGVDALKLASHEFVLEHTGYPAGGVSPIGIRDGEAAIFIDPAVLQQQTVFGGAGTESDLLEISTTDLIRITATCIEPIVQAD